MVNKRTKEIYNSDISGVVYSTAVSVLMEKKDADDLATIEKIEIIT